MSKGDVTRRNAIHWALAKYGVDNFIFKTMETLSDLNAANIREREWVCLLKEMKFQIYNETDGGDGTAGTKWTDERKLKMSISQSGTGNPMYGIQLFGEANGNFGKPMKPHVKEELLKHRRKLSDEQIKEIQTLFTINSYTQTQLSKQFNVSITQIHRIVKGKSWGDKGHDAILTKKNMTADDARMIKTMYATNNYTQKELAKQFSCSANHIGKIISGKKWKDI
jgi:group I intron endonuclease